MLSLKYTRQHRLVDQDEIQRVFRSGNKIGGYSAALYFYPNHLSNPRLCISVGKKQVKKACSRNLIRRIIRESFRLQQYDIPNCDIVVVVWKSILMLDNVQIRQMIKGQWQKLSASAKLV